MYMHVGKSWLIGGALLSLPNCHFHRVRRRMMTESYPKATCLNALAQNFSAIEERIEKACEKAGMARETVRLLPVSKTVSVAQLRLAYQLGYRQFAENKVQEAQEKAEAMADLAPYWAIIGHLQRNKVKYVAKFADEFQALDSLEVAEALNRRLLENGRSMRVLVQVNSSNEASKFGLSPEQVEAFLLSLTRFSQLRVAGLMTLALHSSDKVQVGRCFALMRKLQQQLQPNMPPNMCLNELSMGMSGDFELAILEGATTVRIGQALFGARD